MPGPGNGSACTEEELRITHGLFGSPGFHFSFKQSQRPVFFIWSYIAGSAPVRVASSRPSQNPEVMWTSPNGISMPQLSNDMNVGRSAVTVCRSTSLFIVPEADK